MYTITCRVSGGVTGTRIGPLRKDGEIRYFATYEEAQAEAERLNESLNHSYSLASFSYRVDGERSASRADQHERYIDCGPQAWDDKETR